MKRACKTEEYSFRFFKQINVASVIAVSKRCDYRGQHGIPALPLIIYDLQNDQSKLHFMPNFKKNQLLLDKRPSTISFRFQLDISLNKKKLKQPKIMYIISIVMKTIQFSTYKI